MIQLPRLTQFHYFEIWEPKYSTDEVLLKASKVGTHNKIVFTKAKSLKGKVFYVSGKEVRRFKKIYNNSIWCYAVPMSRLDELELIENKELF